MNGKFVCAIFILLLKIKYIIKNKKKTKDTNMWLIEKIIDKGEE